MVKNKKEKLQCRDQNPFLLEESAIGESSNKDRIRELYSLALREKKPKCLILLQNSIDDSPEYSSLGNKLTDYFFQDPKNIGIEWCKIYCVKNKKYNYSNILTYINKINKILPWIKKELKKIKINNRVSQDAVIHIRCSDSPFNRHFGYHLQSKHYYKWVAKKCKDNNIKKIHFLLCTSHNQDKSKLSRKCQEFAKIIKQWMKEFLPNIFMEPIKCLSILKSFQLMLGCKLLIQGGASPSSFSFLPGIIKGKNFLTPKFISEFLIQDSKSLDKWVSKFPWSMYDGDPLWHYQIKDYNNFNRENSLVPIDFQNKSEIYFKKYFSKIKKKNSKILSLDNILFPSNLKTDHYKFTVGSKEHIEILTELLYLLKIFHEFAEKEKIKYSINTGNLLGYIRDKNFIPWDDDIDIIIADDDAFKIIKLWNSYKEKPLEIWDSNWVYKKIVINSYHIILFKKKKTNFFKIKLSIEKIQFKNQYQKDIGGIDIVTIKRDHIGYLENVSNKFLNFMKTESKKIENYNTIIYGIVETKIFNKELSIIILDTFYPNWRIKKHPKLL